jgi:hypothetical protein
MYVSTILIKRFCQSTIFRSIFCCNGEKDEKVETSPKLARNEQTERDLIRNKEEAMTRAFDQAEEFRRRIDESEREKQRIYQEQTVFVQKMESDKQKLIIQHSQEVSKARELQEKEDRFKKRLERDVIENSRIIKSHAATVEDVKDLVELDRIRLVDIPLDFESIREYFGTHSFRSSIHENSEIVYQKLMEVYNFFIENKIFERKLLLCVSCYISFLEEIIRKGYNETVGDVQLKDTR